MDLTEGMKTALAAAEECSKQNIDVPVGCAIYQGDRLISSAYNTREAEGIATFHAEIRAIEEACRILGDWRLSDCTIFVTLEPCPMCAGAIVAARIGTVVFGAVRTDGALACCNILPKETKIYPGICSRESDLLLKSFFNQRR